MKIMLNKQSRNKKSFIMFKDTDELNFKFNYNNVETKELNQLLNRNNNVTIDNLRRVALWKLDRILSVSHETMSLLNEIAVMTDLSIENEIVRKLLGQMVSEQGIGFPMASAILKFIRPDVFPIIDVRAWRALTGKKITYSQYSVDKYISYAKRIYEIAKNKNIPFNQVDEQLYCYDEKFNGRI